MPVLDINSLDGEMGEASASDVSWKLPLQLKCLPPAILAKFRVAGRSISRIETRSFRGDVFSDPIFLSSPSGNKSHPIVGSNDIGKCRWQSGLFTNSTDISKCLYSWCTK